MEPITHNELESALVAGTWTTLVKGLRRAFKLNQYHFGSMIGFSPTTVSRWENGEAVPTGLALVVLEMLVQVLKLHPCTVIPPALKQNGSTPTAVLRTLFYLELNPTCPQPILPGRRG